MSKVVVHNNIAYLSGQFAAEEHILSDAATQTDSTLKVIENLLSDAGSDKSQIISATIYLKDINSDFDSMNKVWDMWLPENAAPARATVEALLFKPEILVEISVIAALKT